MSETFQPEIKTIEDVSGSVAKTEALHASQTERINLLNSQIGGGKDATIVTREGKKDLWIRKEKGGILKGADAMIPRSTVKVLKAEYKVDAKDGQPKLYYYCEVDNSSTASGGSGTDKGWIYAGYIHMDITTPTIPEVTPVPDPKPKETIDTIPDNFDFKDKNNQPLNTDVAADETVTVSGINKPSLLTITNGEYSIDGGVWNNVPVDVQNGQKIRIRNKTSDKYSTAVTTTVNIGGVEDTYTTTTLKEEEKKVEIKPIKKPEGETEGVTGSTRIAPIDGGGKNETFVDPPRVEGTTKIFDEKSVLENLKQDVNVQKRLPKFLLISQVANTFIQGLRSNPSSHGNKPDQAARLEQKIGAITKELTRLGSKLSTEVPDYTKIESKLLSLEKDMGPIFGESEVIEMIKHIEMVDNEIPLVGSGGTQTPGEVPEWIERKIGSNMRKYILGANGNSGLAIEFMANRLIKRRDVAGTNPKMEQLRTELRNADGAIFNMLETKGWSAVNDYLYNVLKSIGVSDSANDTFRKEAKKAVDNVNQQYNDNAPALKAEFKKELLAKGVPNDASLDGKVLTLFEAKRHDSVSKALTAKLTTKAIRHKADSDKDADDSQLIAEIDSASEDGWVLIGTQVAIDIATILATGGAAGAIGKLAARGVAAGLEYTTLAARAARISRGIVMGTEIATSGALIGGALQIEHNAFDHRDLWADILPAAGWGAAFGIVNGVISTVGNGVIRGGIARASGLGSGPTGRLAAGAVAPWSEESFRAMWALSKNNALSKGVNVAAWGAREAGIVYATMGVIEYTQAKMSDREWHGMTLEEFGPALVMHFVLKNHGDKGPYERAQQKVRDLYKEIQTLKGSDNASSYKSQIDALQKAHDYMSKQLQVTDHLNTIPDPIITPKPEDPKPEPKPEDPKPEPKPLEFMSAKERMTHVKPGETVLITGKDGATMEIIVKKNNNGILEGTAKSKEANGTINPEIPVKMNIRSDGLLVVKNMDGTPYKGLIIKKLSDIAEIEVQPAKSNGETPKPKPEDPKPLEFMSAKERMTHVKIGEKVVITKNDGAKMEVVVKTNNNGIIEGLAKSFEKDGTANPEIPIKMNIRSDGELVIMAMDGKPYKGLSRTKLTDIAEIEVQPAKGNGENPIGPKPEDPKPKPEDPKPKPEDPKPKPEDPKPKPEDPKPKPEEKTPLTPEQIKAGKDLGLKIKAFTRGEFPYDTVFGDNGPNHIDVGGGKQITRHVEGGTAGFGRKETFSIEPAGSKTIGEKFSAEELTRRLSSEQQAKLNKTIDGIGKAVKAKYGNAERIMWEIDGVKHVRLTLSGFSSGATSGPRSQIFEGTVTDVNGQKIYKGVLDRNYRNGKYEGEFIIKESGKNFYDMVNAREGSSQKID